MGHPNEGILPLREGIKKLAIVMDSHKIKQVVVPRQPEGGEITDLSPGLWDFPHMRRDCLQGRNSTIAVPLS